MRAMGMPIWIVVITASTAAPMSGNAHTAADTASGCPRSRSVNSVMSPSVPSDPRKSAVMSYPAEVFRAQVVDITLESFVFELTGTPDKIDAFVVLMEPLGLVEVSRTGVAAMSRGTGEV